MTNRSLFLIFSLLTIVLNSTISSAGNWNQTQFKVGKPKFSKYFYGNKVGEKSCLATQTFYGTSSLKPLSISLKLVEDVIGFDWAKEHGQNSSSLTVNHSKISKPARELFAVSHLAISTSDADLAGKVRKLLVDIARSDTLLNTPTLKEVQSSGGLCYGGKNDTKAVCKFHVVQFAAQFGSNYLIAASLLKDQMSVDELKEINRYIDMLYVRYIKPIFENQSKGKTQFSQMANGGISVLAYAFWKGDRSLGQYAFEKIFKNIDTVFMNDGYIKGTSFRGVRGFWYHSYGTNSAMAVVALAKLWQVPLPKKIIEKVEKAAQLINLGIEDLDKFYSRPDPEGKQFNASYDKRDAIPHVHQMAIGIGHLARVTVGVNLNLEDDLTYKQKVKGEYPSDFTIGFNSNCM
jgi:hypothetical protein